MKNLIKTALTVILVIATVQVMNAQIKGSMHDLSSSGPSGGVHASTTQICVFCHTPHSQSATQYLWNRDDTSSVSYTMYSSPTMQQTATAPGDASKMCLSCHDGTVAYNSLINNPGSGVGTPISITTSNKMSGWDSLGTDLSNDHPIGIAYPTSGSNSGFNNATPGGTYIVGEVGNNAYVKNSGETIELPLSGSTVGSATVECTSCHNPHNPSNGEFLRYKNTGSQICLTCHNI